jgi:hypothetical protein
VLELFKQESNLERWEMQTKFCWGKQEIVLEDGIEQEKFLFRVSGAVRSVKSGFND